MCIYLFLFFLSRGKKIKYLQPQKEKNILSFNYTPTKKGYYDVHLKVNNNIVATYIINVND